MTFVRSLSLVSVVALAFASVACGGSDPGSSDGAVTMTGRVGGSSSTKTFTGVSTSGENLRVVAHEVHKRGEHGRNVEVNVASDGFFSVDLARGSRWMITVDDASGGSAIVSFGGKSVVAAGKDGGSARVDVGSLHVVGGEAQCDVSIDGKFDLAATLAEADEIIEEANGMILDAQAAAAEAQQAALAAANDAQNAAQSAQDQANAAAAAAQSAAGH